MIVDRGGVLEPLGESLWKRWAVIDHGGWFMEPFEKSLWIRWVIAQRLIRELFWNFWEMSPEKVERN